MSRALDDFPGLAEQQQSATMTSELLNIAARQVSALVPGEKWAEQAERYAQAASFASTAATELAVTVGWLRAAHAANEAGLLDGEENDDG